MKSSGSSGSRPAERGHLRGQRFQHHQQLDSLHAREVVHLECVRSFMEEDAKKPGSFELLDQKTKVGTLFFYVLNHASQSAH